MSENVTDNRRQFVRLPKGYSVEINEFKFPITSQQRVTATCADISTGGVCVEAPVPFALNARLQVRVRIPLLNKFMPGFFKAYENDADQYLQAIAEVAWSEPISGGYQVGLRFIDLDPDTTKALTGLINKALREADEKKQSA